MSSMMRCFLRYSSADCLRALSVAMDKLYYYNLDNLTYGVDKNMSKINVWMHFLHRLS